MMGEVVMTYKVNPHTEVEDVDPEAIASTVLGLADDVYDVQAVEIKPLAFGLKFVQVHVKMNDGPGLPDAFEAKMAEIHGVGEIEVLSMGLI
jgi:translation elongation factor aEF-1 beta